LVAAFVVNTTALYVGEAWAQTSGFDYPLSAANNAPRSLEHYSVSSGTQLVHNPKYLAGSGEQENIVVTVPTYILNAGLAARPTVASDTTLLNANALGGFLPSAIPTKGEKFFNTGEHASVISSGAATASVEMLGSFDSSTGTLSPNATLAPDFRIYSTIVTTQAADGTTSAAVSNGYFQWKRVAIGVTDTLFADPDATPETIDIAGPNAHVSISNVNAKFAPAQIRYQFLPLASAGAAGIYGWASVESPNPEITLPTATSQPGGTQHYSAFSVTPDFVVVLGDREGGMAPPYCSDSGASAKFDEHSHIQFGAVFRDLGVENDTATVRDTAFGWGVQLSGGYTIFRDGDACNEYRDLATFGISYGKGIARYFDDLSLVTPVDDAIETSTLNPLGVFGFYAGYTHEWTDEWRSTATYSHLELHDVPNTAAFANYYERGDYLSINLIYHIRECSNNNTKNALAHYLFAGGEALYGQKQEMDGAYGTDWRFMLMVGATK
jgi:hypothetical protein